MSSHTGYTVEQVAAFRQEIDVLRSENQRLASEYDLLRSLLDAAPVIIYVKDSDGRFVFGNSAFGNVLGLDPKRAIGLTNHDIFPQATADAMTAFDQEVIQSGRSIEREEVGETPHGSRIGHSIKFPIPIANGIGIAGITTDITERKALEAEKSKLIKQLELFEVASLELSIPIIPITSQLLIMPLIGTIDSRRAAQVMTRSLELVSKYQAHTLIIDITGVALVDTQVASIFINTARAVQLLGTEVVLTGIRPEIAQTLVSLGIILDIRTFSNLQAAITAILSL